ncbi:MAG: calcium-binding protein, partial [Planctomycetota bacterium]
IAVEVAAAAEGPLEAEIAPEQITVNNVQNVENVIGTEFDDDIRGDNGTNILSGLGGDDFLSGRGGRDVLIGGKGDDEVRGRNGDDLMIWNNGDGSDLFNGGQGDDTVEVNFNTDLVNDDLQNDDTARIEDSAEGVAFARTELNGQSVNGLFELDIRNTETLETNFGGGDDTAEIAGDVLDEIFLDLDGGDGVDTLDFSLASEDVRVDLTTGIINPVSSSQAGSALNFENVIGTDFDDTITGTDDANVIDGGVGVDFISARSGDNTLTGGADQDFFVFTESDTGRDTITDFENGLDLVAIVDGPFDNDSEVLDALVAVDGGVELEVGSKTIFFEEAELGDFSEDDFSLGDVV